MQPFNTTNVALNSIRLSLLVKVICEEFAQFRKDLRRLARKANDLPLLNK